MLDITTWTGGHCLGGIKNVRYGNESRTITRLKGFVKMDQRGFCRGIRLIIHELFHALGFSHMQKRPDRDEYIKVNWENVEPGSYNQFKKTDGANFGLPYDCSSVMHYSKVTFGINRRETMTPIHPDCHLASSDQEWENVRPMLSPGDVKAISIQYKCPSAPSKEECKTTNGKTCVFPFIYKGVKYSGCTIAGSGGTPWCSTVTDKDGNYIDHPSNFHTWGNCGQNCSLSNPITPTSTTTNTSRCKTQRGSPCAFPFIYKGVKYSGCTKVDNGPVQVPWCSTVTDKYGNYIEHPTKFLTWGYCDQDCPSSLHSNEDQVNLQGCQVFAGQYLGAGDDVAKAFHANTNEVENFKNFNFGSFFDSGMFRLVSEESKLSRMDKTSDNWTL